MSVRLVVSDRGIGRLEDDRIKLLETEHADLGAVIAAGQTLSALAGAAVTGEVALADAKILAPVQNPRQIWAVGLNYRAHVEEIKGASLNQPFIFPKAPTAIIGPDEPIVIPEAEPSQVDFEGEMALVISKRAESIKAADAAEYIAGLTICNDVSARTLQKGREGVRSNISMAKSFRTFAPLGPVVALFESVADPENLKIETTVNGEVRQSSTTAAMITGLADLLEFLTARVTLLPGDIIATGTPEGVGDVDGRYLAPGDVVSIELEEVGTLSNPVAAA
jgi:2-keto-4-pentenoate hydratase/2-oxohepta-3-ene-1,7-dioic acid hydratase in catechol pathway